MACLRELGLQLSQLLAQSPHTLLKPSKDHQLPWACSRASVLYETAPFRYSAALATRHLSLLPKLLAEFLNHFFELELGRSELTLQVLNRVASASSGNSSSTRMHGSLLFP